MKTISLALAALILATSPASADPCCRTVREAAIRDEARIDTIQNMINSLIKRRNQLKLEFDAKYHVAPGICCVYDGPIGPNGPYDGDE